VAFESAADALRQLLLSTGGEAFISRSSEKTSAQPGEPYYFVEVALKEETRYVIEAYGKEARQLEREVNSIRGNEKILVTA
jgi:hypothetical protein